MYCVSVYYRLHVKLFTEPAAKLNLLAETHRRIGVWMFPYPLTPATVQAELERIYTYFQGENWSPHGEARDIIRRAGVSHTSMSVGDIVFLDDGHGRCGWHEVADIGWTALRGEEGATMAQITDSGKVYSVDADHPFVLYGQLSLGWFGLGGFATLDEAVAAIPGHSLIVHFQLYDENTERYVWTGLRSGDRAVRREYHTLAVRDEGDDHDTLIHVYTCPHCGADVDKSDDICPACHKVTDPQADYRLVGVPVDGGLVQLTRVRYDATDCPACGHPNHEGRVCECCDEQGNLCCCDRQEQSSAMPAHDDEGVY